MAMATVNPNIRITAAVRFDTDAGTGGKNPPNGHPFSPTLHTTIRRHLFNALQNYARQVILW